MQGMNLGFGQLDWIASFIALILCPLAGWVLCDSLICKHFLRSPTGQHEPGSWDADGGGIPLDAIYEEEEEGIKNHAAHHDSSAAKQQEAALHEARFMATSPCLNVPTVVNGDAVQALRVEGIVRFDNTIGEASPRVREPRRHNAIDVCSGIRQAMDLLAHVNGRLDFALRDQLLRRGRQTLCEEESLLGVTLCAHRRHDVKLDLRDAVVSEALDQAVSVLGPTIAQVLGPGPELFELGAVIADGGAARQPAHPDTPWSLHPSVCTAFIALQVSERELTISKPCIIVPAIGCPCH